VLCAGTISMCAVAMCSGTVLFAVRPCPDDLGSTLSAGMRADALMVMGMRSVPQTPRRG
jgi:hypothetical protein